MKKKIEYLIKKNKIIQYFYVNIFSIIFKMLGIFIKIDKKLILINSFAGLRYNDSPKAIYDEIIKRYRGDFRVVWAFDKSFDSTDINVEKVKIDSFKYFYIALKAKYWITNMNIERGLRFKKKKQIYLNTWHGIGTKTMGLSEKGRRDYDFSKIDYITVQSDFEEKLFIRDFKAKKNSIIKVGLPRNDILTNYSKEDVNKLKKDLNIGSDKKVLLYAPTWRESKDKGSTFSISPPFTMKKWEKLFDQGYILLFRLHHKINKLMNIEFNENVIDVSNYSEMNELLLVTDILITDYSTSIFDYSILERPFLIYGYDYDDYKEERGFVIDYEKSMPYRIIKSENELIRQIENHNNLDIERVKKFKDKFVQYKNNSVKTTVDLLFEVK